MLVLKRDLRHHFMGKGQKSNELRWRRELGWGPEGAPVQGHPEKVLDRK